VLSGRGLCDELITRPEESYRLWCVVVCDLETSWMRRPWPTGGCRAPPPLKVLLTACFGRLGYLQVIKNNGWQTTTICVYYIITYAQTSGVNLY